jgi:hypothetical protein
LEGAHQRQSCGVPWKGVHSRYASHGFSDIDNVAAGVPRAEILASYPSLNPEDLAAALGYAAELAREGSVELPAELTT